MAGTRALRVGRSLVHVPVTALDRAIEVVAPQWAARRFQARAGFTLLSETYHGASRSRRSLTGWNPVEADADADTLRDIPTLRARSRDLLRSAPLAGGAVATTVTNTIGTGLSLQANINARVLGLGEEEAAQWQQHAEDEFALWCDSRDCDITRHQTFFGLQALTFRAVLESGDVAVILARVPPRAGPVPLALQLVEAERLCNPNRAADRAGLVAGVEADAAGAAVAYHFASAHPTVRGARAGTPPLSWARIPATGAASGRRNVLHLFERRRPGQTRGVPFVAPVIEPLKQLERYTDAELMAAVVSGLFTVFIKSEAPASIKPSALSEAEARAGFNGADAWDGQLGNGLVVEMNPKESVETANPGRPNAQFDPFVTAIVRQIGIALELPYEVLVKHYQSSYSAARGAMLDAWRFFRGRRDWIATEFCQPVYEAWLEEAIVAGRIRAPGFLRDPLVKKAWCGALWVGDGPGSIDPAKDVQAARERVELTISTLAQESVLHDGQPWEAKLRRRTREKQLLAGAGMPASEPASGAPAAPPSDPVPNP